MFSVSETHAFAAGFSIGKVLAQLRAPATDLFKRFAGKPVVYWPNPGNAGDSLIAAGTIQALEKSNVEYRIWEDGIDIAGCDVLLGGGGNLVPMYSNLKNALEQSLGHAKTITVLPHTIRGNKELLALLDETCTVCCRDKLSYDYVRKFSPRAEVLLAHDMAFHCDVDRIFENGTLENAMEPVLSKILATAGLSLARIGELPSVDFLRTDRESTVRGPQTEADISKLFAFGVSPSKASTAVWCLLKVIRTARHINTDRLHVAIGCALTGTPCTLRDNSYGKNGQVFDHSLREFPNVRMRLPKKAAASDSAVRTAVISLPSEQANLATFACRNEHLNFRVTRDAAGHGLRNESAVTGTSGRISDIASRAVQIAASHRALWMEAASSPSGLLILETDVITHPDLEDFVSNIIEITRFDLIAFSIDIGGVSETVSPQGLRIVSKFQPQNQSLEWIEEALSRTSVQNVELHRLLHGPGSSCYYVSPEGAKKLLDTLFPKGSAGDMTDSIDRRMNALYPQMKVFVTSPFLAWRTGHTDK
jgi:exopolysaccharide biosynthesis predicted pyruvyltransferase EpsI/GR25 family glycosyltransferase involved in LPS biosynthesis